MRKFFFFLMFICVCVFSVQYTANAWEFTTSGEFEYRYRYVARTGPNDLFGNVNTAQSFGSSGVTTIGLAGPILNIVSPEGYSSKGSSGSLLDQRLIISPTIKVNPAITIKSEYALQGNLNAPLNSYYPSYAGWIVPTSRGPETEAGFSFGQWRSAWIVAQTPIGTISAGRRPFGFGLGWSGFHVDDFTTSSIQLTVPYGPLSFLFAYDLADTGEYTDPLDVRNVNLTPLTATSAWDTNEIRKWNVYAGLKYMSADLDIGYLSRFIYYQHIHATPALVVTTLRDDQTASFAAQFLGPQDSGEPIYGDISFLQQTLYAKYFNGRFFLNAEYTLQNVNAKRTGGREISGWPKAYEVELGAVAGPVKTSLAYFYRSGHDRSGAVLNTTSQNGTTVTGAIVNDTWNQYILFGGGGEAISPYAYLIGLYGGGNNAYDRVGKPTFLDFRAAAIRLDYAVASNLNIYGSFLYAQRASTTGTWKGQFNGGVGQAITTGDNIPDSNLGTELGLGIDWKLLENLSLNTRFAYWEPGAWFKYAYQDLASINTSASGGAPGAGVQAIPVTPGRSIDPIMGFDVRMLVNF